MLNTAEYFLTDDIESKRCDLHAWDLEERKLIELRLDGTDDWVQDATLRQDSDSQTAIFLRRKSLVGMSLGDCSTTFQIWFGLPAMNFESCLSPDGRYAFRAAPEFYGTRSIVKTDNGKVCFVYEPKSETCWEGQIPSVRFSAGSAYWATLW